MVSSNNPSISPEENAGNLPIEITLASWSRRFLAWILDFIIVSIGLGILFALISIPFWFDYNVGRASKSLEPFHYLISSFVFFAYWTYCESKTGQSIGKNILKIKITDLSGKRIDIQSAAIESFGKAFYFH